MILYALSQTDCLSELPKLYMKNLVITLATIVSASVLMSSPAIAGTGTYGSTTTVCQPTYGGNTCENNKLLINKKVADPATMTKGGTPTFTDNLSVNDDKYSAGQTVTFQIVVTNTGDNDLTNVAVKDVLPAYLTASNNTNSGWNFDSNSKTLSTTINSLKKGESKTFTLTAVVVSSSQLPSGQDVTCVINQSFASVNDMNVQDNAQLCIQKSMTVFPTPVTKTTPKTGSEMLTLVGLIPSAIGGLLLRKRAITSR